MIQAVSVLAMVWLHLFCTMDFSGLFQPLIFIKDIPLTFYLAQLSDFCVMGFAFCSGYAHMIKINQKGYYKNRLLKWFYLLINFWIILIAISVVGLIADKDGSIPGSLQTFIGNFFLYRYTYNGAWWYMLTYSFIVIISPLILKAVKKINPFIVLIISFGIYFSAYYVRFKVDSGNWFVLQYGTFGMTLFEYIVGAVFYQHRIFSKLGKIKVFLDKKSRAIMPIASALVFCAMLFAHTLIVPSFFVAPFTGCVLIILFKLNQKPVIVENALLFVGRHSTNIWLIHMFFYIDPFANLVYAAKYPVLIFAFMIAVCIIVSTIINLLHKNIVKLIDQKINYRFQLKADKNIKAQ